MKAENVKVSDADFMEICNMYENKSVTDNQFKIACIEHIENARVPNHSILRKLRNFNTTRSQAMMAFYNFQANGMGFGVVK